MASVKVTTMLRILDIIFVLSWFLFFQHFGIKWLGAYMYMHFGWSLPVLPSYLLYFAISFFAPSLYLLLKYGVEGLLKKLPINIYKLQVCVASGVIIWILSIFQRLLVTNAPTDFSQFHHVSNAIIIIILLGPLVEELLFRGVLFEVISNRWGNRTALFTISIISLIAHYSAISSFGAAIIVFLSAIIFTLTYMEGGLLAVVLVHSFANGIILSSASF